MDTKVIFIGNSIVEEWAAKHSDFFSSNHYLAKGKSGQTTTEFLSHFQNDVINVHPQAVVIGGGINDIAENYGGYDPEKTLGNIALMAEIAQSNGIKVILTSVLPASEIPWRREVNDVPLKITNLNNRIKSYALLKGYKYIDYYSKMVDVEKGMIAEYTTDGVHVTLEGYEIMESLAEASIDQILE